MTNKETQPHPSNLDTDILLQQIASEITSLLIQKNNLYGDKNLLTYGLLGISVRLSDKIARLVNFIETNNTNIESVEDTLKDIAGYAINALRLIEQGKLSTLGTIFNTTQPINKEED